MKIWFGRFRLDTGSADIVMHITTVAASST